MHCTRLTWRQKYVGEVNKTWFHSKIRERARALVERRAKALAFKILRNLENFRMQGFRGFSGLGQSKNRQISSKFFALCPLMV